MLFMSKRVKSRCRLSKKIFNFYKNIWGNPKKDFCRSMLSAKKKKVSLFGKFLMIKQGLKLFYSNLSEKSFKKYLILAIKSPSKTIDKFISILERRLDTVLYRSLFVSSFFEARQLINHGFVYINNKQVVLPHIKLYQQDFVYLKKIINSLDLFRFFILVKSMPNYLEMNFVCFTIIFLWDTNIANVYYPLNLKYSLINRFYK
jgi:small subunit ribosomal protein S4